MPLVVESGIMKVGNSEVLLLPKALSNTYVIEKGAKVTIIAQDDGIFVPLKTRQDVSALLKKYRQREPVIEKAASEEQETKAQGGM